LTLIHAAESLISLICSYSKVYCRFGAA